MSGQTVEQYVAEVEALRAEIAATRDRLGFKRNDTRTAYFNNASNALANYAISLTLLHLAQLVGKSDFTVVMNGKRVVLKDSLVPRIINALFEKYNQGGETLWNTYLAKLKAKLFHEVWSGFEDALRRVYHSDAVPHEQREEDAAAERARYKKEPKRVHLSFITAIWKRLASLAKRAGATSEMRKYHFDAVDFFSAARNTIHSSTFYEGDEEKQLQLAHETLTLTPGQPMGFSYPNTMLAIVRRLTEAFEFICVNVKYDGEITSPVSLRDPMKDWPEPKREATEPAKFAAHDSCSGDSTTICSALIGYARTIARRLFRIISVRSPTSRQEPS